MKTYENSAPVNHVGMTSSSVKNLFSALVQDLLFVKVYEVENRKELIDTITLIGSMAGLQGAAWVSFFLVSDLL